MKFGKLTVIGAVLAASMYLTGIARADKMCIRDRPGIQEAKARG